MIWIQQYVLLTQVWLVYCFLKKGAHNGFCFFTKQKAEKIDLS